MLRLVVNYPVSKFSARLRIHSMYTYEYIRVHCTLYRYTYLIYSYVGTYWRNDENFATSVPPNYATALLHRWVRHW